MRCPPTAAQRLLHQSAVKMYSRLLYSTVAYCRRHCIAAVHKPVRAHTRGNMVAIRLPTRTGPCQQRSSPGAQPSAIHGQLPFINWPRCQLL